ncbi:hypothetical protein Lesp02_30320 [Lentzea sp. NBRC 105346]|uniref:hypothetical protein n=1 Tax=Lentzea sp. NBRC 105346 TaxID=3032205 RepID=UPI0024A2609A|nr:hypothetical protein [Lentzea sp. NBRC 105346]GLZ30843.1 hypothetical protein Lesp02_30320 [Lentzea sp. NBRC 105346]
MGRYRKETLTAMSRSKSPCQLYERGATVSGNQLHADYFAAVELENLPTRELANQGHIVERGYAVATAGQWFFFPAREPAVAFGIAARMSTDCRSWDILHAVREVVYCERHEIDETVLLLGPRDVVERTDRAAQLTALKRFVQAVKEHAWSSHWHEPTGYITDYNGGKPVKTSRKSLPL